MEQEEAFAIKVINEFTLRITDEIFKFIQNDKELMYEYLRVVESRSLDKTNQEIGRAIRELFNFDNKGRENNPTSTLIQSYEKHAIKDI